MFVTYMFVNTEKSAHNFIEKDPRTIAPYFMYKGLCFFCYQSQQLVILPVFIDWRYSHSCWYFRPSFVNCCPSNLFSVHISPLPCVKVLCVQTVYDWEGVVVLSPVGDHILQEFNTLNLTRFRTYKIARPPQTKT